MITVHLVLLLVKTNCPQLTNADKITWLNQPVQPQNGSCANHKKHQSRQMNCAYSQSCDVLKQLEMVSAGLFLKEQKPYGSRVTC